MKKIALALSALIFLSGCAEVELASHIAKKTMNTGKDYPADYPAQASRTAQEGKFKIGKPYEVMGKTYYPKESYDLVETGIASWYGPGFDGRKTANGETFDKTELTAAHRTLQMPSLVRVTNLDNGRSLVVRVNDRGPYKRSRVIDVSEQAAQLLGFKHIGTAKVRLEVLKEESLRVAQAAKQGLDTNGYEMALNRNLGSGAANQGYQVAAAGTAGPGVVPMPVREVRREYLNAPSQSGEGGYEGIIPGHTREGSFYPDPVVTEMPVTDSRIYVQAGSFSIYGNAAQLGDTLRDYGPIKVVPAQVDDQQFYRVRIGPLQDVREADMVLAQVVDAGNSSAVIVVE